MNADPKAGQSTQPDPIGLAGGLNLYGYAGGDPINRHDPFGLFDLKIVGDELAREIADLRASNPEADATFRALEESDELFVIVDGQAAGCEICGFGAGQSFDRQWEEQMRAMPGVANYIDANHPGARGFSYVNRARARDAAGTAWHEAGHLRGIADKGSLHLHPSCPSQVIGIPGWACP